MSDLRMKRGDSARWRIAVTQPTAADPTVREPVSLVGKTLRFMAKRLRDDTDATAVIAKSTPNAGIAVTDASGGIAELSLAAADTNALSPQVLLWELQLESGADRNTLDGGSLHIEADLVRA